MPLIVSMYRYAIRFFPSWIFAIIVYFLLNCYSGSETLSIECFVRQFFHPYYHLWYVLGFLFCVLSVLIYIKIVKQYNAANMCGEDLLNYLLLLTLSIILIIVELTGFMNLNNTIVERILSIIEYSIRPQYLFFFSIGLIARQGKLDTMYEKIKHKTQCYCYCSQL